MEVQIYCMIWENFKSNSLCVVEVINPPTPRSAHCAAHPLLHQKHREEVSGRKSKKEGRKEIRKEKIITDKSEENTHKKSKGLQKLKDKNSLAWVKTSTKSKT